MERSFEMWFQLPENIMEEKEQMLTISIDFKKGFKWKRLKWNKARQLLLLLSLQFTKMNRRRIKLWFSQN